MSQQHIEPFVKTSSLHDINSMEYRIERMICYLKAIDAQHNVVIKHKLKLVWIKYDEILIYTKLTDVIKFITLTRCDSLKPWSYFMGTQSINVNLNHEGKIKRKDTALRR